VEKVGSSTIHTLIISGLLAILGTVAGGIVKGYWDVQLAERKFYSDLVLKALESNSADERLESLRLLVHTNLLKESSIREGVDKYIEEKKKDPSSIPQVKPVAAQMLEAPIIENARIYLLAGNKEKASEFNNLRSELAVAGFAVIGAKSLIDPGRPDLPEIRYFHAADKVQAERIAEYMRFKLSTGTLQATQYQDAKAKPGYIEIWLGK
jgi:hypothetical protein